MALLHSWQLNISAFGKFLSSVLSNLAPSFKINSQFRTGDTRYSWAGTGNTAYSWAGTTTSRTVISRLSKFALVWLWLLLCIQKVHVSNPEPAYVRVNKSFPPPLSENFQHQKLERNTFVPLKIRQRNASPILLPRPCLPTLSLPPCYCVTAPNFNRLCYWNLITISVLRG
jgi:hypothetical protein